MNELYEWKVSLYIDCLLLKISKVIKGFCALVEGLSAIIMVSGGGLDLVSLFSSFSQSGQWWRVWSGQSGQSVQSGQSRWVWSVSFQV